MAKRRKREKDAITKIKESLLKKLHAFRETKILVGTPIYEGLRPLMPMFVRYLNYESMNYKNLKWFWVINNSKPEFVKEMEEYKDLNNFPLEILDLGEIPDKLEAVRQCENAIWKKAIDDNYQVLYSLEQDNLPVIPTPYGDPLDIMIWHLAKPEIGMVSGKYFYKKLGHAIGDGEFFHAGLNEGNLDGDRRMDMVVVKQTNELAKAQMKQKLPYADVDGLPFGMTVIKRDVFSKLFEFPPEKELHPYGTTDLWYSNEVKKMGWKLRRLHDVVSQHLFVKEDKKTIITY